MRSANESHSELAPQGFSEERKLLNKKNTIILAARFPTNGTGD
jgi:hypothetical protein